MKQVSFMCDDDVHEVIENWCPEHDRTFSEAIRHGLRMFFGPKKRKPPEKLGRKVFIIPDLDEIRSYVISKGYTFDPEAFFAFYQSKEWKIGNQPMRDWQAACVTWQKRQPNGTRPPPAEARSEEDSKAFQKKHILFEKTLPVEQRRITADWSEKDWRLFEEADK